MKKLLPIILLFLLLGTACRPLYIPNVANVPLMSEAGETQVALQMGSNGYNLQMAFSPAYHIGLMGSGNLYSVEQGVNFDSTFRHRSGELGLGLYTRLDKYWRIEAYGGIGGGQTGDEIDLGYYQNFFFQPNIGVSGRIADAGFTPKFTFVNHFRSESGGVERPEDKRGTFFEPSFTVRAGYEQFKFHFQAGRAFSLGQNEIPDFQKWTLSFGFHLTFVKNFEKYL